MLAPRFRWLMVVLAGAFFAGCSATPVPIPGSPDSGTTILADAGSRDSSASRDGAIFPDAGVVPSTDAMGGGDGAPDAVVSDAVVSDAEAGAGDAEAGMNDAATSDAEQPDLDLAQHDALPDDLSNEGDL